MMDEQGTRFEVLVEDMGRQLSAVAESNHALAAAFADMRADSSRRFDQIDVKLVGMTIEMHDLKVAVDKLEVAVDKLEAFANDAGPRLVRIETHLALPAPRPRRETTRPTPSKHHRRKPTKRN